MAKARPPLVRLGEMTPGQLGDCFALLAERTRNARRDGKPRISKPSVANITAVLGTAPAAAPKEQRT